MRLSNQGMKSSFCTCFLVYFKIPNYMGPLGAPIQVYIFYKRLNNSDEASGISFPSQMVWNWGGPLCHCSHDCISAGTEESFCLFLPHKMKMVTGYSTAVQGTIMTANSANSAEISLLGPRALRVASADQIYP